MCPGRLPNGPVLQKLVSFKSTAVQPAAGFQSTAVQPASSARRRRCHFSSSLQTVGRLNASAPAPASVSTEGSAGALAPVSTGGLPDASLSAPAKSPDPVPVPVPEGFEDEPPPLSVPVPEGFEDEPPLLPIPEGFEDGPHPSLEPQGLRRRSSGPHCRSSGLQWFLQGSPEPRRGCNQLPHRSTEFLRGSSTLLGQPPDHMLLHRRPPRLLLSRHRLHRLLLSRRRPLWSEPLGRPPELYTCSGRRST
ncbi:hypothetical protein CRENBAI_018566 [Crenichthys baileyi]|uniref:Uncharacterized protein n=1 Tax=Crenichthys baileyi TaxID=28760 RepID=A0AAV9R8E4_9TELE